MTNSDCNQLCVSVVCLFRSLSLAFLNLMPVISSGPFKINGVPIRRVNQTYVIATSTKVDISKVSVEKFDDKYFTREKKTRAKKTEGELFETEKEVTSMRHHSLEQVLVLSILF